MTRRWRHSLCRLAVLALLLGGIAVTYANAQIGGGGLNNPFPLNPAEVGGLNALLHAQLGGL